MSIHEPQRAELATVVRACAHHYRERHGLTGSEDRVLRAIAACRTLAMGGHIAACNACGSEHYCYHSCRNRHCPKCQTRAKEQWLDRQRLQLLPVPYFHVVFTLPHSLNGLIRANARVMYGVLFDAAAKTLQAFADNPKWLGGQMGFTLVLHTWSQTLTQRCAKTTCCRCLAISSRTRHGKRSSPRYANSRGWCISSRHWQVQSKCFSISLATHIASPLATSAWCASMITTWCCATDHHAVAQRTRRKRCA